MTMATQLSSVVPGPSPMRGLEGSDLTLCLFCYKKCPKTDEDLGRFVNLVGIWLGRQISSRCLEGEDGGCCGECRLLVEGVCTAVEKWKEMEDNVRGKMGKLKRRILRSNRGPEIWQEKRRRIEEGEGQWRKEFREELLQEGGSGGRGVKMEVQEELSEWVLEYFVGWIATLAAVTVLALEEPPGPFERGCGCVQMEGETRTSGQSFGGVRGSIGEVDAQGILDQLRKELRQASEVNSTAFLEELVGMPIYSQQSQVEDGEDGLGDEGQVPSDVGEVSEVLGVNLEENGSMESLEGAEVVKPAVETQDPMPNDLEEASGVPEVNHDERMETEQREEPAKTFPMEPPTISSLPSGSRVPEVGVNPDNNRRGEEPPENSVGPIVETQEEMSSDIQDVSVIPEASTNETSNAGIYTEPPQEPSMPPPISMKPPTILSQCSYSCKFCAKMFSSEITLRQHIRCHHTPSRSFLLQNYCSYCKVSFPNIVLLRKHNLYSESHKLLKNDMLKKKAKLSKSSSSQQESLSSQSESTSQCSQRDASFSESEELSNPPPPPVPQESQSAKENDAQELVTPTPSTSQVPPETNQVQVKQENVDHVEIDIEESSKDSDSEPNIVFIEEIQVQPKTPIPSPNPGPSKSPPVSKNKKTKDVPYFPCSVDDCDAKFSSKEKYKLHRKYHTPGKFKCQFCKDVKSTLVKLAQHEQRRHVKKKDNRGEKNILCSRCNARFDKVARYYAHFADAHVIQLKKKKRPRINCKKCGVQIYKQDWEAHRRQAHGKSNGKKKNEKGLRCLDCPMRFHGQLNFQEHLIRVHNLYMCQECGKTFENKYSLDLHMTLKKAVKGKK